MTGSSTGHVSQTIEVRVSSHPDPPVRPLDQPSASAETTRGRRQRIPS